ncbi:MAG: hypothetical protein JNK64_32790 [Myxococcales bacterium]|nr:hypothetical protein [Myxococcales bacterium]
MTPPAVVRRLPAARWLALLPRDPRAALLASDEPSARYVTLTAVLGAPDDDRAVRAARAAVVADPGVRALVDRLPDWRAGVRFGGHASPAFPPNLLGLLYALGVRAGDFARVDRLLDAMPRQQADDGRYLTPSRGAGTRVQWASLPCDHVAILEALLRFGRRDAPGVDAALARVRDTFTATRQGHAWGCIPDPVVKWRGPGRTGDACPQVTAEALRLFALVPPAARPRGLVGAARTLLAVWRDRDRAKPYMFGHGPRFVAGKWPPTWYDVSTVLATLAAYPAVWRGAAATAADRRATGELVAALASTFDADGMITPRSCYQGFADYSFGQKQRPSPWATARACGLLRGFAALVPTPAGRSA